MAMTDINLHKRQDSYLKHIDGLRAIAVTLVVLFHLGIVEVSGGFIGVDVFFVISGFLMTRILARGVSDDSFIPHFFARRARRIVPAYLAMLCVASVASLIIFLPVHLKMLALTLPSAVVFLSNFVFWRTTDYFSPDLSYNVLLHTWSLAVEWQFYLFYPICFIAARRFALPIWLAIGIPAVISFVSCEILVETSKTIPSFYLLPTRVWEFVVGGAVAIVPAWRIRPIYHIALSIIGLCLIFYCGIYYGRSTVFPGVAALWPCLGAALLIFSGGEAALITGALTLRPMRILGRASYSIYLWHWPIIVLVEYRTVQDPRHIQVGMILLLILLSIIGGIASWQYVERPFRSRRDGGELPLSWLLLTGLIPIACAALIIVSSGFPQRFSSSVVALSDAYQDVGKFRGCLAKLPGPNGDVGNLCTLGVARASPTFIVLGDSHAAALAEGLSSLAEQRGWSGLLSVSDACAPVMNFPGGYLPTRKRCAVLQGEMQNLIRKLKPSFVILHGAWAEYYSRDPQNFSYQLRQTLQWLQSMGPKVYLIGDTPGALDNVPLSRAKQAAFGLPVREVAAIPYLAESAPLKGFLIQATSSSGAQYIDLAGPLCIGKEYCQETAEGYPLYWDAAHLSGRGSIYVVNRIADMFTR